MNGYTKDILPGQDWSHEIKSAIQAADFFLALLSTNSIRKRGEVQRELKLALHVWSGKLEEDIYLIPVRLEDCKIPDSMRQFQWIDLFHKTGFQRLIEAIHNGAVKRHRLSISDAPGNNLTYGSDLDHASRSAANIPNPKFFYYISKPKVEMLLSQLESTPTEESFPARTLRLSGALTRSGLLTPLSPASRINSEGLYIDRDEWRTGLYYFRTDVSITVAFFHWKKLNGQLIILAGSPDHLVGQRVVEDGTTLSSTGDALATLGSSEILGALRTDEVPYVTVGGGRQRRRSGELPRQRLSFRLPRRSDFEGPDELGEIYTNCSATGLAIFCERQLAVLPKMRAEVAFKIYSTTVAERGNFYEDLKIEYGPGADAYSTLYSDSNLQKAMLLGLENLRKIHIGSPI